MSGRLCRWIDDAIAEILRRDSTYFERFPLVFPVSEGLPAESENGLSSSSHTETAEILATTVSQCRARGATIRQDVSARDPVADMILKTALAGRRPLSEICLHADELDLMSCIRVDYREGTTRRGSRYFVRRDGSIPVVLVNAIGAPLDPWSQLIADRSHDLRIIIVESQCADLFNGGMRRYVDLGSDVEEIYSALSRERIGQFSVLGWCSGGRAATELAVRGADQVSFLVLVSPSFCGAAGVGPQLTGFESGIGQMCTTVRQNPAAANFFVRSIEKLAQSGDWARNLHDPIKRGAALFKLPAKRRAGALVASMLDCEFLRNYAARDLSDSEYQIHEALKRVAAPILLITGDHDNIVNSEYVSSVLDVWGNDVTLAEISGAGHYAQDLQYAHLTSLIDRFLNGTFPSSNERVAVRSIGKSTISKSSK
ncbi:alpha/beta hydrolase [Bradyrhizobium prioriisuperbiae]|uniref:alpha/beta fold hydrolase n=1 Tax=Bradyrhizobium prioriisuperbiae TaxID=2854389 RepID=UPI0028E73292|nr:alpha/beta hydrolase [Bradyrhizobium prioritasuperba]